MNKDEIKKYYLHALNGQSWHRHDAKVDGITTVYDLMHVREEPLQMPAYRLGIRRKGMRILALLGTRGGSSHVGLGHHEARWNPEHKRNVPGVFLQQHWDVLKKNDRVKRLLFLGAAAAAHHEFIQE